jgi:hypothetical protein
MREGFRNLLHEALSRDRGHGPVERMSGRLTLDGDTADRDPLQE